MTNPLDAVTAWYEVVLDSLRVTARVIGEEIPRAVTERHLFYKEPEAVSLDRISQSKEQLADLVVFRLVSVFERTVRDSLSSHPRLARAPGGPDLIDSALRDQMLSDLEYWKLSEEVLAIFSARVHRDLIGQVKQVVDYRNWVAHGQSPTRPPRSRVTPEHAYRILSAFLRDSGLL